MDTEEEMKEIASIIVAKIKLNIQGFLALRKKQYIEAFSAITVRSMQRFLKFELHELTQEVEQQLKDSVNQVALGGSS